MAVGTTEVRTELGRAAVRLATGLRTEEAAEDAATAVYADGAAAEETTAEEAA